MKGSDQEIDKGQVKVCFHDKYPVLYNEVPPAFTSMINHSRYWHCVKSLACRWDVQYKLVRSWAQICVLLHSVWLGDNTANICPRHTRDGLLKKKKKSWFFFQSHGRHGKENMYLVHLCTRHSNSSHPHSDLFLYYTQNCSFPLETAMWFYHTLMFV